MIYFDNAATTWPKPKPVVQATARALATLGNPGRSGHKLAIDASMELYQCREALAGFLGGQALDYAFCMSCTDALNQAIQGMATVNAHVITTALEHNSVLRPLNTLKLRGTLDYTVVSPRPDGYIYPEDIAAAILPSTTLVIVNHASNVTGAVQDVASIGDLCKRRGIPLLVDAAQSVGYVSIDVTHIGAEMVAFPGHKGLLGPQGCGGLYLAPGCRPEPLRQGGTGSMSMELVQPWEMPDRYESGTPPTPAICGMHKGIEIMREKSAVIWQREVELTAQLYEGLAKLPHVTVYGPPPSRPRVGVVSFNVADLDASAVADVLYTRYDIASRAGLHCAPLAHRFLGTQQRGAVRFSLGPYNTAAEVSEAVKAVQTLSSKGLG